MQADSGPIKQNTFKPSTAVNHPLCPRLSGSSCDEEVESQGRVGPQSKKNTKQTQIVTRII